MTAKSNVDIPIKSCDPEPDITMTLPQMIVGPYSETKQLQNQTRFVIIIGCDLETKINMTTPRVRFVVSNISPDNFTASISSYQDHDYIKFMRLTNI